ncbi:hypothetical protein ACHAAC_05210 [Aeromicrobium sp. CF4.19]|uniref:hypothetical protein n=1 Tax=Aeromicrobium sp. CF4.19 TaxID=3373082 RepID=UPI003EE6850D
MPQDRTRPRLAAAVAASLVALFVVVVGAASSHAAPVRVGSVAAGSGPALAGPADLSTASDDDAVAQELGGQAPAAAGSPAPTRVRLDVPELDDVASTAPQRPTGRAPPTA